jgi:hypothetical protein
MIASFYPLLSLTLILPSRPATSLNSHNFGSNQNVMIENTYLHEYVKNLFFWWTTSFKIDLHKSMWFLFWCFPWLFGDLHFHNTFYDNIVFKDLLCMRFH